jgi:hypothetical protein
MANHYTACYVFRYSMNMRETASPEPIKRRGGHRAGISPGQAAEWLGLVEQGMTNRQIADRFGIKQVRTIGKHVDRAREAAEDLAVRREVLRAAVEEHQRDLLRTAASLREELIPGPGVWLDPRPLATGGKPLAALLAHTAGSDVPALLQAWDAVVTEYDDGLKRIEQSATIASTVMEFDVDGTVAAVTADAVAFSRSGELPPLLPWRDRSDDGIWYGALRIQAGGDRPMGDLAQAWVLFRQIRDAALASAERVRTVQRKALSIREALIDILDDITLSRYVGGSCRWCPGTSPRRQTVARRARSSR